MARAIWTKVCRAMDEPVVEGIEGTIVYSGAHGSGTVDFTYASGLRRIAIAGEKPGLLLQLHHEIVILLGDLPIVVAKEGTMHPPSEVTMMLQPGEGRPIVDAVEGQGGLVDLRSVDPLTGVEEHILVDTTGPIVRRRSTASLTIELVRFRTFTSQPRTDLSPWRERDTPTPVGAVWIRHDDAEPEKFSADWQVLVNGQLAYSLQRIGSDLEALQHWAKERARRVQYLNADG